MEKLSDDNYKILPAKYRSALQLITEKLKQDEKSTDGNNDAFSNRNDRFQAALSSFSTSSSSANLRERRIQDLALVLQFLKLMERRPKVYQSNFYNFGDSDQMELLMARSLFNNRLNSLNELNRDQRDTLRSLSPFLNQLQGDSNFNNNDDSHEFANLFSSQPFGVSNSPIFNNPSAPAPPPLFPSPQAPAPAPLPPFSPAAPAPAPAPVTSLLPAPRPIPTITNPLQVVCTS